MTCSPWTLQLHPEVWVVVAGAGILYALAVRSPPYRADRREVAAFAGALVAAFVVLSWPLADLATRWSLAALVLQRMVLLLAVPALLLLGVPRTVLARLTRPAGVDAVLRAVSRPVAAVALVTVVSVGTLTAGAVQLQATSPPARAGLDLALVAAGVVLWAPVLPRFPSTDRPSPLGRAAYLIVQSILPSFLAVVWIFAHHPLYPTFDRRVPGLPLSPVTDQLIAGFLAKFGTIGVLWSVAFVIVNRSHLGSEDHQDLEPLTWVDVERQLERVARADRRDR